MKIINFIFVIIFTLSGYYVGSENAHNRPKSDITIQYANQVNEEDLKSTEIEAFLLLRNYDGNWYINGILGYFFYTDPINLDYTGTAISSDDKFIYSRLNIDTTNNKVTFDGDNTYKVILVSELSSDELAWTLFSPDWENVGKNLAREICGDTYYEEDGIFGGHSEGNPVKYIRFENTPADSKYSDFISLIISSKGDLLINIGECAGTYTLLRGQKTKLDT